MNGYDDHIDYVEPDDTKRNYFVKILEVGKLFVKYETTSGNVCYLPWHRVLKVKLHGGEV
jgi:uncharacterized protein (UPF0248 family)